MFIYTAGREKIELKLLKTNLKSHKNAMRLHVGSGEYASRLSEQVTCAAVQHLQMPSRTDAIEKMSKERLGDSTAVFEESQTGATRVVYKEVAIRFGSKIAARTRKQILDKHELKIRYKNAFIPDQIVAYDASGKQAGLEMLRIANDCAEMEEVVFATPNFISKYHRNLVVPPIPTEQWHLCNRGHIRGQVSGEDVNARQAWSTTQGNRKITVAVLDDGVDVVHPNLKSNIKKNPDSQEPRDTCGRDFFVPDTNPDHFNPQPKVFKYKFDDMGINDIHGTPCAGIIAAEGKDALGIAPNCRILPVKIFHARDLVPDASVADAIRYAALHADILSCSWVGPASPDIELAIADARKIGREGKGSAVFCASGNNSFFFSGVAYPAAFDDAIAVGASTDQGIRAVYSQFGPELWIVAPSNGGKRGIYTTDVSIQKRGFNLGSDDDGGTDGLHYNNFFGTSAATPLAAGVAALVLSVKTSLDLDAVKQILADTADKIGDGYDPHTGHSSKYGYGRVNAGAAVDAASAM